jgi:hypothetical protein
MKTETPRTDELSRIVQNQNWGFRDMQILARQLERELNMNSRNANPNAMAAFYGMTKWMEEATALLCYQPEVPMKHKEDLCDAMNEYKQILHAIEITEPQNAEVSDPGQKRYE